MQHFNIQIAIQQVTTEDIRPGQARGIAQATTGEKRDIVKMVEVAVSAPTLDEAYEKAHRLLDASAPQTITIPQHPR